MCLTITKPRVNILKELFINSNSWLKPKIAQKDIVVFKIYLQYNDNNVVESPFQCKVYNLDAPFPEVSLLAFEVSDRSASVHEGYHSLKTLEEVGKAQSEYSVLKKHSAKIFQCIIPKGSEYYEGRWDWTLGYVSNNLIVQHKIQ